MKTIIVCSRLSYGGAEHVAVLLANGFAVKRHDVILATNMNDRVTYFADDNVRKSNLFGKERKGVKKWLKATLNLRRLLKNERPDVVIGVMSTCSLIAKIASLRLGIPIIATEHNSFERPTSAPFSWWEKICKFILNKLYDGVTVLTEADRLIILNRIKSVVMPNPLALKPIETVSIRQKTTLAVGRLDAWHVKGFDVVIKAWGTIMKNEEYRMKNSGWRLQIAGTGSEESLNYLKQLCRENGVGNSVDFLGFVSDMESLYKKTSVFVLSSRYEGFGLVLIEAMSQGCACVACDFKGRQREIIQNDSQGLCCEPDNVDVLAESLLKMICEDDYREYVRKNAIERSKYYSIENTINRWEEYLYQIVKK